MKYRCKYEYTKEHLARRHVWTCIGRHGAMHFHVSDMGEEFEKNHGQRYSGGLETHYREPPDYMADHCPSQDKCWLLNQPCWHDGTSLYASETLIPRWLIAPNDHDAVFRMLQMEYDNRFEPKADAA